MITLPCDIYCSMNTMGTKRLTDIQHVIPVGNKNNNNNDNNHDNNDNNDNHNFTIKDDLYEENTSNQFKSINVHISFL